ncbi:MAG: hypothetical protein M0Z27_00115 [Thermaerobacter sp.]|nr:hypothetical protein [Thermaerobacter sp.]
MPAIWGIQGAWLAEIYPTDVRATAANFTYYVGRSLEGGLAPLGALAQSLGGDARTAMVMGIVGVAGAALLVLGLAETRGGPCARRWVGRRKCCRNDRRPGGDREAS